MFSVSVSCDSAAAYQPQCASRAGRQRQLCGNVAQASPFYWSPPTALSGVSTNPAPDTSCGRLPSFAQWEAKDLLLGSWRGRLYKLFKIKQRINVCRVPHKLADSPSITSTSPDPPAAKAPDQSEGAIHLVINEVHGAFRLLKACRIPYTWLRQHRYRRITAGFNLMHIQGVAELLSLSSEVLKWP
ncbi:hypothetical protein J6590_059469 [Homalodisca vitripennis]|nr:hypothetical protein J6590_059469 [Homalodisca vitripennis]